jgi:hypothetical protein
MGYEKNNIYDDGIGFGLPWAVEWLQSQPNDTFGYSTINQCASEIERGYLR